MLELFVFFASYFVQGLHVEDYVSRHPGIIPAASRARPMAPTGYPEQQQHGFSAGFNMPMAAGLPTRPTMPVSPMEWAPRTPATWLPHGPPVPGQFHPPCASGGLVPEPMNPPSWISQPMMSNPHLPRAPAVPVPEPLNPPSWHGHHVPTAAGGGEHLGMVSKVHGAGLGAPSSSFPSPPEIKACHPAPAPSQSPGLRPSKDLGFCLAFFSPEDIHEFDPNDWFPRYSYSQYLGFS